MGIAESTRSSYTSQQRNFVQFCKDHRVENLIPTSEDLLCLWSAHLAKSIKHRSIKVYLSGIRSLHVDLGYSNPLFERPRLERILRGIKRCQGVNHIRPR